MFEFTSFMLSMQNVHFLTINEIKEKVIQLSLSKTIPISIRKLLVNAFSVSPPQKKKNSHFRLLPNHKTLKAFKRDEVLVPLKVLLLFAHMKRSIQGWIQVRRNNRLRKVPSFNNFFRSHCYINIGQKSCREKCCLFPTVNFLCTIDVIFLVHFHVIFMNVGYMV